MRNKGIKRGIVLAVIAAIVMLLSSTTNAQTVVTCQLSDTTNPSLQNADGSYNLPVVVSLNTTYQDGITNPEYAFEYTAQRGSGTPSTFDLSNAPFTDWTPSSTGTWTIRVTMREVIMGGQALSEVLCTSSLVIVIASNAPPPVITLPPTTTTQPPTTTTTPPVITIPPPITPTPVITTPTPTTTIPASAVKGQTTLPHTGISSIALAMLGVLLIVAGGLLKGLHE